MHADADKGGGRSCQVIQNSSLVHAGAMSASGAFVSSTRRVVAQRHFHGLQTCAESVFLRTPVTAVAQPMHTQSWVTAVGKKDFMPGPGVWEGGTTNRGGCGEIERSTYVHVCTGYMLIAPSPQTNAAGKLVRYKQQHNAGTNTEREDGQPYWGAACVLMIDAVSCCPQVQLKRTWHTSTALDSGLGFFLRSRG